MTPTPKDIHQQDQLTAAMAQVGAAIARLYHMLREQNVPQDDAAIIVAGFAQGWAVTLSSKKTDS